MKTLDLRVGQEVFVWRMNEIINATIEEKYETAISVSYVDNKGEELRLMTYDWHLFLDDIIQEFIANLNCKHNKNYVIG